MAYLLKDGRWVNNRTGAVAPPSNGLPGIFASGQAPAVSGFMSEREKEVYSLQAGGPVNSFSDLEDYGMDLDTRNHTSPGKPTRESFQDAFHNRDRDDEVIVGKSEPLPGVAGENARKVSSLISKAKARKGI